MDPGSSIVAISEACVIHHKIAYDPEAGRSMQCANSTCNCTLGLTQNVPVKLDGGLRVYMQMHVVRNAAYDVLLGRPFDVLMKSVVENFANGRQLLTVVDPSTTKKVTIEMYTRR